MFEVEVSSIIVRSARRQVASGCRVHYRCSQPNCSPASDPAVSPLRARQERLQCKRSTVGHHPRITKVTNLPRDRRRPRALNNYWAFEPSVSANL
jgi:hypothetical protein